VFRVQGDALAARPRAQRAALLGRELDPLLDEAVRASGRCALRKRRARGRLAERACPEAASILELALRQPADEVPVGRARSERGLAPRRAGLERREKLADQQRDGPAVEDRVVVAPDLHPALVREPQQGDAQQRRAIEREAARAVGDQECVERVLSVLERMLAQIVDLEGERHGVRAMDHLQRRGHAFPREGRAQHGVACEQRAPRALQRRRIERTVQLQGDLREVAGAVRLAQGLHEHALLHRRDRVDVLDRSPAHASDPRPRSRSSAA
jgi:hypothetical protein